MTFLSELNDYTQEVLSICKDSLPEAEVFDSLSETEIGNILIQSAFDGCTTQEAVERIASEAGISLDN